MTTRPLSPLLSDMLDNTPGVPGKPAVQVPATPATAASKGPSVCPRCRAGGLGSKIDTAQEARSIIVTGGTSNHYHTCAKGLQPRMPTDLIAASKGVVVDTTPLQVDTGRAQRLASATGTAVTVQTAAGVTTTAVPALDAPVWSGTMGNLVADIAKSAPHKVDPVGTQVWDTRPSRDNLDAWQSPGYSPVDDARVAADEAAAADAGFVLPTTLFRRGRLINQVGVDNATEKRGEWLKLPPAEQGMDNLAAIVAGEKRCDVTIAVPDLGMDPTGRLYKRSGTDLSSQWGIERGAFTQTFQRLATVAGVSSPGGAFTDWTKPRLKRGRIAAFNALCDQITEDTAEAHTAYNRLTARQKARPENKQPTTPVVVLRTREGNGGTRSVFATVSDSYTPVDVDTLAAACAAAVKDKGLRSDVFYDGSSCKIDLLAHSPVPAKHCAVGEIFQGGVRLQAHDNGKGGIGICGVLWRNRCENYIVIGESVLSFGKFRHIGDIKRLTEAVNKALAKALKSIEHFVKAWDEGCKRNVHTNLLAERGSQTRLSDLLAQYERAQQSADLRDELLSGAFRGLSERKILPIGARKIEDEIDLLIQAHDDERNQGAAIDGGRITSASLANAVSLYAHDMQRDARQEIALEDAAGQILAMAAPIPWAAHSDRLSM
jgi:hypothetical protein